MSAKIIKDGTVITFDEGADSLKILPRASILIEDNRISAIETKFEDLNIPQDTEVIDASGKIVSAGFIDTHRHLWQTAYRTVGPNTTLASYMLWLGQFSETTHSAFTAEDIYNSCLGGAYDALNGGVTTVLDHAHANWSKEVVDASLEGAHDGGGRVFWCHDLYPRDNFSLEEQIKGFKNLVKRHRSRPSLVSLGMAYDHLDRASDTEIETHLFLLRDLKLEVLTMHCMGGPWPFGGASPELAEKYGLLSSSTPCVFAHGAFLNDDDVRALRQNDHFVSVAAESEMHFGHGITATMDIHDKVSLGIDCSWTFGSDLMTQARLWLQFNRQKKYQKTLDEGLIPETNPMTVEQVYLQATRHGGLALRRKDLGVLKVGARADIVVFNGDSPNMLGWQDPIAAVILHANVGDIEHVLVDGEFRKRNGCLTIKDGTLEDHKARFKATAARVQELNKTPPSLPDKLLGVGRFGSVEEVKLGKPAL